MLVEILDSNSHYSYNQNKFACRAPVQQVGIDAPLFVDYSEDSIDSAVFNELPASIQREIRLSMMASQKPVKKQLSKSNTGMHRFLKPRT